MIEVFYDGACEPINPGGNAGFGALIKMDGKTIWEKSDFVGEGSKMSNNVAEYAGMIGVLEELINRGLEDERIVVHGDNKMTIMQMAGAWKAKKGLYLPWYWKCRALVKRFDRIEFKWIPREMNSEADALSKQALKHRNVAFHIQPESNVPR
jgi:ribonuclease HI